MRVPSFRILLLAAIGAIALAHVGADEAAALDPIEVVVETWSSPNGRAYVGVQAAGEWAVPAVETAEVVRPYYSVWDLMGVTQPFCRAYWVWVYGSASVWAGCSPHP